MDQIVWRECNNRNSVVEVVVLDDMTISNCWELRSA